jgi:hypothetical protein
MAAHAATRALEPSALRAERDKLFDTLLTLSDELAVARGTSGRPEPKADRASPVFVYLRPPANRDTTYHALGCKHAPGPVTLERAEELGLLPCELCRPSARLLNQEVWVTYFGDRYHRETCNLVPRPVSLVTAKESHTPCPYCNPPSEVTRGEAKDQR